MPLGGSVHGVVVAFTSPTQTRQDGDKEERRGEIRKKEGDTEERKKQEKNKRREREFAANTTEEKQRKKAKITNAKNLMPINASSEHKVSCAGLLPNGGQEPP